MSLPEILVEVDKVLVNADILTVSYGSIKQGLYDVFTKESVDPFKKDITEYITSKVVELVQVNVEGEDEDDEGSVVNDASDEEVVVIPTAKNKRKIGGGFSKPLQLSSELAELMGEDMLARTEVVKRLWVYIKEHKLQDPKDGRFLLCDTKLEKVFKKKRISIFKMQQPLSTMMKNADFLQDGADDSDDEEEVTPKRKREVVKKSSSSSSKIQKSPKKISSAVSKTSSSGGKFGNVQLSPDLSSILGTSLLPRTEVIKQLWVYIKEKNLQDPSDKRYIMCDAKLKGVFKEKRVSMFGMNKVLATHMTKHDEGSSVTSSAKKTIKAESKESNGEGEEEEVSYEKDKKRAKKV